MTRLSVEQCHFILTHCSVTQFWYPESLPTEALTFFSAEDLRWKVQRSGSHFFDDATMRWFDSRMSDDLVDWRFFVTSEKPPYGPREYSVRWVYKYDDNKQLQTDRFDTLFRTLAQAKGFARRAAKMLPRGCEFESENHSDDMMTIFDGSHPRSLCGYHLQKEGTKCLS